MSKPENVKHHYIANQTQLDNASNILESSNELSVDLEFDKNRFRYGFNLCLIQIYNGNDTYLIDPLTDIELSPIFKIFENPTITKIVFSFGEDLRLLHSLGCQPKGLFDLQMASAFLNFPPSSLANLLKSVLGVHLSKSSQQSNWFNRPLTSAQINYAIEDVIHLPAMYSEFCTAIEERGVKEWIDQEMKYFESVNHAHANQNEILKEKYKGDMNQVEWQIFSKLMMLREEQAKLINRPPYHIAERKTLFEIARNSDKLENWMVIKSNHPSTKSQKFIEKLEEAIKTAIEEAKVLNLSKRKRAIIKPSREEYEQIKALEQKVKFAKVHFFKPIQKDLDSRYGEYTRSFMLNNRVIRDLVSGNTSTLLPYKKDLFKSTIESLGLKGEKFIPNFAEL